MPNVAFSTTDAPTIMKSLHGIYEVWNGSKGSCPKLHLRLMISGADPLYLAMLAFHHTRLVGPPLSSHLHWSCPVVSQASNNYYLQHGKYSVLVPTGRMRVLS